MGWDAIADLASGIFKRFFSKEVADKNQRKELTKLRRDLDEAFELPNTPANNQRIASILHKIRTITDDKTAA